MTWKIKVEGYKGVILKWSYYDKTIFIKYIYLKSSRWKSQV